MSFGISLSVLQVYAKRTIAFSRSTFLNGRVSVMKGSAEPVVAVFEAIAPLHVSAHKARGTFLFRRVYLFGYITAVGNIT